MTLSPRPRRARAVSTASLLTLGGALFTAMPAHAAEETPVVATEDTAGNAAPRPDVDSTPDAPTDTTPDSDEAPGTRPDEETTPDTDEQSPVDSAEAIEITSPINGSTVDSRTVTYTGTAPAGSQITATTEYPLIGELALGPIPVDESGTFQIIIPFAPATENPVRVTFTGATVEGGTLEPVTVDLNLPDPVAAPVITSPSSPAISGTTVTFAGTGIAGNGIVLVIVPTDEASAAALAAVDPLSLAQPIVVAEDGTWSATYTLAFGNFAATAVHTSNPTETLIPEILSLPSTPVSFSLVAPVITTTASIDGTPVLAETGFENGGLVGLGGLALVLGAGMVLAGRRTSTRSAQL